MVTNQTADTKNRADNRKGKTMAKNQKPNVEKIFADLDRLEEQIRKTKRAASRVACSVIHLHGSCEQGGAFEAQHEVWEALSVATAKAIRASNLIRAKYQAPDNREAKTMETFISPNYTVLWRLHTDHSTMDVREADYHTFDAALDFTRETLGDLRRIGDGMNPLPGQCSIHKAVDRVRELVTRARSWAHHAKINAEACGNQPLVEEITNWRTRAALVEAGV